VIHTVTYLRGIQPWQNIAYTVGVICLWGIAVMLFIQVMTRM